MYTFMYINSIQKQVESAVQSSLGYGHEYTACVIAFVQAHIALSKHEPTKSVVKLLEALEICAKGPYKTYTVDDSDNYHVDIVTAIVKTASKIRSNVSMLYYQVSTALSCSPDTANCYDMLGYMYAYCDRSVFI